MLILETKLLTVDFNGFKAVSDLDFTLNKGDIRTILGPNGAGKTTFIDLITGKIKPTKGTIDFKGNDLTKLNSTAISKLGVGRKFQGPNVFENLTVKENIEVAITRNTSVLHSMFLSRHLKAEREIEHILNNVGLSSRKEVLAEILSHGEKQWLEMGMILAQDPELIILDEPTTGMTVEETYKTGELIQSIFNDRTVIVIEHDMNFVKQIAKEVTVLHQGKTLAEGSLNEIEENEKVQQVYLRSN